MSQKIEKEIKVPPMGESITEAIIARWLKKQGEEVELDEPLVELETDKVTLEVGSPETGVLSEILVPQGATVHVGAIIGRVREGVTAKRSPKETPKTKPLEAPTPTRSEEVSLSPAVRKLVEEHQIDPRRLQGQGKDGRLTKGDVLAF